MLQNTGAVISIAFVLAIVTASVPEGRAAEHLLRGHRAPLEREARPVHPQHAHRPLGAGGHLADRRVRVPDAPWPRRRGRASAPPRGRSCSATKGRHWSGPDERAAQAPHRRGRRAHRDHPADDPLLRGDRPAAERSGAREPGAHRLYDDGRRRAASGSCSSSSRCSASRSRSCASSPRPRRARAGLRREWHEGIADPVRRRERARGGRSPTSTASSSWSAAARDAIAKLEAELVARRRRVRDRLRELEAPALGARNAG